MDNATAFALLVSLLESARRLKLPADFAEGTLSVWQSAIAQVKALVPGASIPPFSSVDQNLLNAFVDAAQANPSEPLGDVVRDAQIKVLTAPGMAEHYQLLLLIELAVVARNDTTLSWQD